MQKEKSVFGTAFILIAGMITFGTINTMSMLYVIDLLPK